MPSYKLSYFDARGRAEVIRLLLAYAGKEFEDARVPREEWPAFKPKTPFGQMPVLEIDGQMMGQTVAICNFLAREFGLYGKTNCQSFEIDQIVCVVNDFIMARVRAMKESDQAKKAELMKAYNETDCPRYLDLLEGLLQKNGTEYFVGSEVTLADIWVYDRIWTVNSRLPDALDKYPLLKRHLDRIGSLPQIETYVGNRKQTEN